MTTVNNQVQAEQNNQKQENAQSHAGKYLTLLVVIEEAQKTQGGRKVEILLLGCNSKLAFCFYKSTMELAHSQSKVHRKKGISAPLPRCCRQRLHQKESKDLQELHHHRQH